MSNEDFYVDIADPCANNTCQNGATCVRDGLASYKCQCTPVFGGDMCETSLPSREIFEIHSK
jgi:hypothetical protein